MGFVSSCRSSGDPPPESQTSPRSDPEYFSDDDALSSDGCYLRADGRYGIYAGGHPQAVPVTQLLPSPPVEADPGGVPAGGADGDPELHPGGEDDGAEGETVGTDGRHHHGRHAGVDHAGSGSQGVGRAARGGGHDQTVALTEDYHH